MTLRPATDADVDAIRQVAERSWRVDYPDILTRETAADAVTDWYAPVTLEAELAQPRTLLLVAERDDAVVGFAHATWSGDEAEGYILRLYVHPDHRRQRVGRDLLERTVRHLAEAGVERISAMVLAANEPGRTFYEQFGFTPADERDTVIGGERYPERRLVTERPFDLGG